MYKVNVKNGNTFMFARYFDKKKDAIRYRDDYNSSGFNATLQSKRVSVYYHHTALQRGYVRKGCGYDEYYNGKFGTGFKRHLDNRVRKVSNTYHYIDYYLEV